MGSQNPFIEIVGSNPKIVIPPWHLGFWKKILKKISILIAILLSADRSKQSYILRTSQINQLQRFPNRNLYSCGQTNQNCLNRKLNVKTKLPLKEYPPSTTSTSTISTTPNSSPSISLASSPTSSSSSNPLPSSPTSSSTAPSP